MSQANVSHLSRAELGAATPRYIQGGYHRDARPGTLKKEKFTPKGHDRQLHEAEKGRWPVEILTITEGLYRGVIECRDRYTVTLCMSSGPDSGKSVILYKSAMESILIDKPANPVDAPASNDE